MKKLLSVALAFACVLAMATSSLAAAESPAEFYKKNKITLVVGSKPGGGSDIGGRLIAKFWNDVTGGEMLIKNMSGASGIVGLNYVTNSAKADGLTMFMQMFGDCYLMSYLTKNPASRYDSTKLNYIAGCYIEPWAVVVNEKFKTLDDLKKAKKLRLGGMSRNSSGVFSSLALLSILDLQGNIVTGYQSMAEAILAVGKGELDLVVTPLTLAMQQASQGVVPQPWFLMLDKRDPAEPDMPVLTEFVDMTPEQRKVFDEMSFMSTSVRMAAMREGVDPERVKYVREAFARIEQLPAFREAVSKINRTGPGFLLGQDLDKFVSDCFALDITSIEKLLNTYCPLK